MFVRCRAIRHYHRFSILGLYLILSLSINFSEINAQRTRRPAPARPKPAAIPAKPSPATPSTSAPVVPDIVLIPYLKGDKWGYCDVNKKIVIEPKYETAELFRTSATWVRQGYESWGLIDKTGKELTPFKYERIRLFNESGSAWARVGNKWGLVDKTGKELTPFKYDLTEPTEVLTGDQFIFEEYGVVGSFSEGLGKVSIRKSAAIPGMPFNVALVSVGFIDVTGKEVIPLQYVNAGEFSEGWAVVCYADKTFGYIDKTGKETIAQRFEVAGPFAEGLLRRRSASMAHTTVPAVYSDARGSNRSMPDSSLTWNSMIRLKRSLTPGISGAPTT